MNERTATETLKKGGYLLGLGYIVIHKLRVDETWKESLALNYLMTELDYKAMSMREYNETQMYL